MCTVRDTKIIFLYWPRLLLGWRAVLQQKETCTHLLGGRVYCNLVYLWQAISSDSSIPNSSPSHVGRSEVDVPFHILSPPPFPTGISVNLHQSTSQLVNRLTINQGISQSVDRSINHSTNAGQLTFSPSKTEGSQFGTLWRNIPDLERTSRRAPGN